MERENARIVELDVRPYLREKLEPFQLIMDTVKALEPDDIFVLHATFKPTPLLGILKLKGFDGKAERIGKDHWISTFVRKKNKHWLQDPPSCEVDSDEDVPVSTQANGAKSIFLDNRGLEPPQPMRRTLSALARSRPGDEVTIHNDRVPMFLIEELHALGYPYTVENQPDGSAKVTIQKT